MLAIFIDSLSYAKLNVSNKKCPNISFDFADIWHKYRDFEDKIWRQEVISPIKNVATRFINELAKNHSEIQKNSVLENPISR